MPNDSNREKEIFEQALDLTTADRRAAFLQEACGEDAALLTRIQALLQAHAAAGDFLPAQPRAGTVVLPSEKAGDRIGRYKLLQQIGEGGCGVVYMAEQQEPVRRRVALKIIKLGMDTKQVIARFEAERQALAMMDHPNISKVLDAGATDTGRPYFVMELVRGLKITDFCDQGNLSTADRLALFVQVCQALQHAHQKGIVHRDIKPSNILVTVNDGVPVPKVIDFGIAKATAGPLTDKTLFTAFDQFIGTPAYMSPEQAAMTSLEIDARSDIYSLGVLLYELLIGQTPFDAGELFAAGLDEIRRTIREKEPARPSTRLSTMLMADLTAVAKQRQSDPPKLIHLVRGDLDWIVMRALEKDRARRYDSASSLAQDVQRHLADQPVLARPPGLFYRIQKLVRRRQSAFALAGAATLAVVAALFIGMRISRPSMFAGLKKSAPIAAAAALPAAPIPLRLVSGTVVAADSGRAIADALVCVASPARELRSIRSPEQGVYQARSDQDGHFKIQVPQNDKISLNAFAPGFEEAAGPWRSGNWTLHNLPFSSPQKTGYTIKLRHAMYLSGVVTDEVGHPVAGARVTATGEQKNSMSYIAFADTDDHGRFEIFDFGLKLPLDERGQPNLEKMRQLLDATSFSLPDERGQLTVEHATMLRSIIPDIYQLGETGRTNLSVALRRGHDVTGVLTSASGRPVAKTMVEAVPSDHSAARKDSLTDSNGRFEIRGLPDGELTINAHSLIVEQKAVATVRLAGADAEVNLRLEPIVFKKLPNVVSLFGMKLADMTAELQAAYDLPGPTGVIILDPGPDHLRLGIGSLREGECFWIVGKKTVKNLREMAAEMLRINKIEPPGGLDEGCRGSVRVVYHYPGGSGTNTQHLKLTDEDVAELEKLAAMLN